MMDTTAICKAKVRHETKGAAKRAARRQRSRKGKIDAYRCEVCGFWHVGHELDAAGKAFFRTRRRGLAA